MFQPCTTPRRKPAPHWAGMLLLASFLVAGPAAARPSNLDRSLDRPSEQSLFRVQLQSAKTPVPLWRVHQWRVHLSDSAGQPVSGAILSVDGGMPDHRHGLPTEPRVAPAEAPGDYVISGVKFSMPGWWVLKLVIIGPDGKADTITFNIVL